MRMLTELWNDEGGAVFSAELILLLTILVIGMIVGLSAIRDSVISELGDGVQAISNVSQFLSFGGTAGPSAFTSGSQFVDLADFGDSSAPGGQQSKCVVICVAPTTEGTAP